MILSIRKQREEAVRKKTVHWRARARFPYSGQQAPSPDPIHDIYPSTLYSFTSTEPRDPWNHHRPSQSFPWALSASLAIRGPIPPFPLRLYLIEMNYRPKHRGLSDSIQKHPPETRPSGPGHSVRNSKGYSRQQTREELIKVTFGPAGRCFHRPGFISIDNALQVFHSKQTSI